MEKKERRLKIRPMEDFEIEQLANQTENEELKRAYFQMLTGSKDHPMQRLWYIPWSIELKETRKRIGEIGFRGPCREGSLEIGYGIDEEFREKGYATEAVQAMLTFAFNDKSVLLVEAESEETNTASLRVLEKVGFQPLCRGEEGPRFYLKRPKSNFTALGLCLGLCAGMALGTILLGHSSIGMCVGVVLGFFVGHNMDTKEKKKVEATIQKRKEQIVVE